MTDIDCERVFELVFGRKLSRVWLNTLVGGETALEAIHKSNGMKEIVGPHGEKSCFLGLPPRLEVSVIGKLSGQHTSDFVWIGPEDAKELQTQLRVKMSYEALRAFGFEKWEFDHNGAWIRVPLKDPAAKLLRRDIGRAVIDQLKSFHSGVYVTLGYGIEELLEAKCLEEVEMKMDLEGCKKTTRRKQC